MTARPTRKPRKDAMARLLYRMDSMADGLYPAPYVSRERARNRRLVAALLRERADAAEIAASCYPHNQHAATVRAAVLSRPRKAVRK